MRSVVGFWVLAGVLAIDSRLAHSSTGDGARGAWTGPELTIASDSVDERAPAIAYNSNHDEYLVVWTDSSTGSASEILGQRIFADGGGLAGGDVTVSSGAEDRDNPKLAHNAVRNQYLVTWDVAGSNVSAVRLSATGATVGGEFSIAGWPSVERGPTVASCRYADQYLVAWESDQDTGGADWAIYMRFVTGTGEPGSVRLVDDTAAPEREVETVCDAVGYQYLMVWQSVFTNLKYGVIGRVILPNGGWWPSFTIQQPWEPYDRIAPVAAGGRGQFLVGWENEAGFVVNYDIHARLHFPEEMFLDGFQTGTTERWSSTAP